MTDAVTEYRKSSGGLWTSQVLPLCSQGLKLPG